MVDMPKNKTKPNRKDRQILGSCKRVEKSMGYEGDCVTYCDWYARNGPQGSGQKTCGIENQSKNRDHLGHCIITFG